MRAALLDGKAAVPVGLREPYDLAIRHCQVPAISPSGSQPARPMHYGQLLTDFNKGPERVAP